MKHTITYMLFILASGLSISLSAQSLNIPLLTVDASHTSYAPVDEIHFTIVLQNHEPTIEEARIKNKTTAQKIFSFLDEKNIPKRLVQSRSMRINRNYIGNRNAKKYDGFIASQEIYVCLTDVEAYDAIADALLVMDIQGLNGPYFKSSIYDEVLQATQVQALQKAKARGKILAEALDQSIGSAKLVTTNYSFNQNNAYSTQSNPEAGAVGSASSFEVGEIQITATVQVSFVLFD